MKFFCDVASLSEISTVGLYAESLIKELTGDSEYCLPSNGLDAIREIISNPKHGFCVLAKTLDGDVAGYAGVSFQLSVRTAGIYAIIQELYVLPKYRSTGLGQTLVRFSIEKAASSNITKIEVGLPTDKYQPLDQLKHFYQKNGFNKVGDRMRMII